MHRLLRLSIPLVLLSTAATSAVAAEPHVIRTFKKTQLSNEFFAEGATFADVNHDGASDVIAGPFWWAGPKFTERHEYYPAKPFNIDAYSANFLAFSHDFNNDGWTDILIVGFPGVDTTWFENPQNKPGPWPRHLVLAVTDNESPTFTDVTGDGKPELVCMTGGQFGYAEIPKDDPTQPWKFTAATPKRDYQRFTHGMGVGDVNNDGRMDLLEKNGWWEQPAKIADGTMWTLHEVKFSPDGGSQMYAYDFDGDGDNDVLTSKAAHAYGLSWFENTGKGEAGAINFQEHKIMGERPEENDYGVAFSQLHAVDLVDMDGDGVKDIVTGKRWWAHSQHDPGSLDPAVLYWFRTVRDGGKVRFVPYLIDDNSGIGTQVVAGDITGDRLPDVVVGNKKGTFIHVQKVEEVDEATWKKAQPKTREESTKAAPPPAASGLAPPTTTTAEPAEGFPAAAADGRALNLDFETGDLTDWTIVDGEEDGKKPAFDGQPVEGDAVHARRADDFSGHQGKYWLGTFERRGDGAQGVLRSVPFKVTHPYASFLVGGGAGNALGAEIVDRESMKVLFHGSGRAAEKMTLAVADLRSVLGKEVFLRVVDHGSAGWAHTNFDNFRFHNTPPKFQQPTTGALKADDYPYAGLPAEEAVKVMKLPPGFNVRLFAAEPDVKQPIAMALDHRGRLWIAEAYEYPIRAPEGKGRDRILIFEDADGDGKFDKRTVFAEHLNLVSGMEVGFGGVWVGAAPYLLFIPDRNGDDKPDGPPEILLDGFAYQDTHETLNAFIWGPDGWLYGCHGVFTHSLVGKPGTPDDKRTPLDAAIWRYHPTRHTFEVFAEGTSNPWGVDFDDYGEAFCTACVIPHLYHIIPGGRYQRQAGPHLNPYTYEDIQTIADHRHYVGDNPHGGNGRSGDAGGGHAHAGAMIYLGGLWPDEYRGRIFMNNIHGQRINTDILKPEGSGYVGSHGPDFLLSYDLASQILNLRYGPDGNAYVIDWYDTNACHHTTVEGHDRTNGRIYKICYGESKPVKVDLTNLSTRSLAEMVLNKNDWYVRHARRLLQERAASGKVDNAARARLVDIATTSPDPTRQLRAIWALEATGGTPLEVISKAFVSTNEHVRARAVRVLAEGPEGAQVAHGRFAFDAMAASDPSPIVRLALASVLQQAPLEERWTVVAALVKHAEDANDHNLPLMYWYAMEPLAAVDQSRALALGLSCGKTIPLLRKFMIQRIASIGTPEALDALLQPVIDHDDADEAHEVLAGIREALKGQRQVSPPANWSAAYAKALKSANEEVRRQASALGVAFGDASAMAALRATVDAAQGDPTARREALEALLRAKDPGLLPSLLRLVGDSALREPVLSGLALYDDPQVAPAVLAAYPTLSPQEKRAALATLSSRAPYALQLLTAVKAQQIPAADLAADLVRQLQNLKNPELDKLVAETWGQMRSTPEEKLKLIESMRQLVASPSAPPDLALGRAVFAKTCQQCHTLYGAGAKIGPDITGANRADLAYLLTNIVDPSAVIPKDYLQTIILTSGGQTVSGIVRGEDEKSITLQTTTAAVVIPKDEIEDRQLSKVSMMPDDQLKQFTSLQIASLLAYLGGKEQTPLLATKDNVEQFFNGKDLAGWKGDDKLWSVKDGELIGHSDGLSRNEFLFSDMVAENFDLTLEIKLAKNEGNSGVQFRSEPLEGGEARGYQADVGVGWWGKLYEESARGILSEKSGEEFVKKDDWNEYRIVAGGSHIQTWLNGHPCADVDDPPGKRRGQFAVQLHAGGPTEVRFRKIKLKVLD